VSGGIINGARGCAHFFFLNILLGSKFLFVSLEFEGILFLAWLDSLIIFIKSLKQSCDMLCLDFKFNIVKAAVDMFDVFLYADRRGC
jgi:hypothetical protein